MRPWFRSYLLLVRWTALRLRFVLPLVLIVQVFLAVGIVIGFAYLIPGIDAATALYLATGAPTLGLITIGMVMAPQLIAQSKLEGTFDYNRTLPVPRTAVLAADLTTWLVTGAPGLLLGLLTAVLRFDLDLRISPLAVVAVLLVALTATTAGFALAYAAPPSATSLVTQTLVFVALLFSPINFPAERLPGWLQAVHRVLPFEYMAQAVRESLTSPAGGIAALPYAVLGAWCAGGLVITLRVMTRRR
ncbi:multidrug ABC transporter permease [Actinoplanes sp. NBRC 14428]|uniref:ABC-2 type transport system permease protein n=1 Tax=Pseudosporangium ferrugineum TaxID=439699 RepID=A0A2T0SCV7_9ACTN|nr:ABC transporter permease [Pseudosporangium ferrugineum]PRY31269.1 ABC-2 type transport system permease protein [Pseudosporangium ferrugineum]BCJ54595.1 multidrug ABC transporter permease [Actinoplanes sp. NBRC 14428]